MYVVLTILLMAAAQAGLIASGLILRTTALRIRELDRAAEPRRFADRLLIGGIAYLVVGCLFVAFAFAAPHAAVWFLLNGIFLIAGSVELLISMQLAFRSGDLDSGRARQTIANWLRVTGTALCFSPLVIIPVSPFLALSVFGVLGTIAAVHLAASRRRMDQNAVLWTLASAGQSNSPLAEELDAAARGLSGRQRRKTQLLAELLHQGFALDEALERTPGVIPHFAVLAAQVGAKNGTLSKSLRLAAARHSGDDRRSIASGASSPLLLSIYLVAVPLIAIFIVFGLMKWIVPKFKEIFEGFASELPPLTNSVIAFSDWYAEYWYLFQPLFVLAIVAAIWLAVAYCRGWGDNNIPLVGRLFRRLDVPGLLRNLAATAAAGQPLENALTIFSVNHRRTAMRKTMIRVSDDVRNGQVCWAALQKSGLLRPREIAVVEAAGRAGNLPWALEQLADSIERRQAYRWLSVLEVVQPLIVAAIGIAVAIICLAFFVPILQLINDLS